MKQIEPEDNIGPAYVVLSLVLFGGGLFFIATDLKEHGLSWVHFGLFLVLVMLFLAIARPKKFDVVIKNLADKIPGFTYSKTSSKVKTQEHVAPKSDGD